MAKNKDKEATAKIYLDRLRPKKDGSCSVKVMVYYNRKRKYFTTDISLTPEEFDKVINAERRTREQKEVLAKIEYYLTKAKSIINELNIFTFDSFEEAYFEKRNVSNSVSFAFDKYIKELKSEERIGTAVSYECAKNSLDQFNKNLTFADITAKTLKKYERWMTDNGKSITTVGIYLRSLRAIYNLQKIDKSIYPFGDKQGQYSIPTGKNTKKALTIEEVGRIFNYNAPEGSTKEMAKDYWLFLYLCNGMNVKDFCLLKWSNIEGDMIKYHRSKTKRSKRDQKEITISLKPETKEIIKKWGIPSVNKDSFIFPHLNNKMTAEKQRATYQQLTKIINKYIKIICKEQGIEKNVTTYFARHSFATVLKRSGTNIEMISELLGHSSVDVTENYLDGFEKEQIQKETDALTGFKKAN